MSAACASTPLPEIEWGPERVSRVILGTVQLGMDYGIANVHGKPDSATARAIVEAAWEAGIRHFDTAQAYGTSEAVLGEALRDLGVAGEARVASKLAMVAGAAGPDDAAASIERTFKNLGVERLWCLMLHHPRILDFWDDWLGELLAGLRDQGQIAHLGVSLSSLEDAPRCLANPAMEVLQLPCNAWDRRPIQQGVFENARKNGRLCCARSLYLQGLLTLPPEDAAARLPGAERAARCWQEFAERQQLSQKELAIRFGMSLGVPLVIGVETPHQLRETVALARCGPLDREAVSALAAALDPVLDDEILEPWRWPAR